MPLVSRATLPLFRLTLPFTTLKHQLCRHLKNPLLQSRGAAELMASFLLGLGLGPCVEGAQQTAFLQSLGCKG